MRSKALQLLKVKLINSYSLENSKLAKSVNRFLVEGPINWEEAIAEKVSKSEPMLFGRLGGVEASCLGIYKDLGNGYRRPLRYLQAKFLYKKRVAQLCNNAGVYPASRESFDFFCFEHIAALLEINIFSVWGKPTAWIEENFISKPQILVVSGDASYPWFESRDGFSKVGWANAFRGKKILVISPFIKSISEQVPKLSQLFESLIIPNIEFSYLEAPLSQGGLNDGKSYEIHLKNLKTSMEQQDFDIALVSAGAYSLPLAAYAKKMGKSGIHGGGATQIFFGITGQRYDSYAQVVKFKNAHWKRPYESERPHNWQSIEDGCYW
jgi:hypothetical protein